MHCSFFLGHVTCFLFSDWLMCTVLPPHWIMRTIGPYVATYWELFSTQDKSLFLIWFNSSIQVLCEGEDLNQSKEQTVAPLKCNDGVHACVIFIGETTVSRCQVPNRNPLLQSRKLIKCCGFTSCATYKIYFVSLATGI